MDNSRHTRDSSRRNSMDVRRDYGFSAYQGNDTDNYSIERQGENSFDMDYYTDFSR